MKQLFTFFLSLTIFMGCASRDSSRSSGNLNIRISNVSAYDFKSITINTSTGDVVFPNVNSNMRSKYNSFELAYRYAFVELEIDNEVYTVQPIDYVGETPLDDGFYTYEIDANKTQGQYTKLSLTLLVD